MKTQVVLLGTGTPNACPEASGPAAALIVGERAYLIDCGPGIVRQCAKAYHRGIDALSPKNLSFALITHLHSDHTLGLPDLMYTPWVLERCRPLKIFGPKGTQAMTQALEQAYAADIDFRCHGFEKANDQGWRCEVKELSEDGLFWQDDYVQIEAFPVSHGTLASWGYRFTTFEGKTAVFSGDTKALPIMETMASGADILVHECFYAAGLAQREPKWQTYHAAVHTSTLDLARIASEAQPKLVVTTHRIYHMEIQDNRTSLAERIAKRETAMMEEIRSLYAGLVVHGHDLDVYEL